MDLCARVSGGGGLLIAQEVRSLGDGTAVNLLPKQAGVTPGSGLGWRRVAAHPISSIQHLCVAGQHARKQLTQQYVTQCRQRHARDVAVYQRRLHRLPMTKKKVPKFAVSTMGT